VLAGAAVGAVPWPRDAVLVLVERGDRTIVPRGDVVLEPGDRVTMFATPAARAALDALVRPSPGTPDGTSAPAVDRRDAASIPSVPPAPKPRTD
jgi:NhaP-type Na+/H+ and K+/H+ antiporter